MKAKEETVIDRIPLFAPAKKCSERNLPVCDALEQNGYTLIYIGYKSKSESGICVWYKDGVFLSSHNIYYKRMKYFVNGYLHITNKDVVTLSDTEMMIVQKKHPKLFRKSKIKNFLSEE